MITTSTRVEDAVIAGAPFNEPVPGHWDTPEGTEKANEYAALTRDELCMGGLTDFQLANAQYLVGRHDLDLLAYQTAAKERIRWLSAQLALARSLSQGAGHEQ